VEFFAWFEADCLARRDADLGAGARIAADAGFAGPDAEDAKAAQFDSVTGGESLFQPLEDGIHGGFGLGPGQARSLNHVMDNILLDHRLGPLQRFPDQCLLARCYCESGPLSIFA
jgi:hypothetical protein